MRPPFDRVYCVSLARSADRRKNAAAELAAVGLGDFRFFDATDQDDPVVTDYRQRGAVATFPPCFRCGRRICDCPNNVLIDPQVATFVTFKRLWEEIVANDVGVALIVEDDVKFTDYAARLVREALTPAGLASCGMTPGEESLLRLGWARGADHAWNGGFSFVPGILRMANPAFAMTNALARKLLATFTSIDTTVDIFIHERVGLKVNNHTLFPPLAYELSASTGGFPSLIRAKRIRAHYLRQTRPDDAEAIEAAERLAAQQITRIEPREILCVGHPRCGSRYMAELLSAFGLDVGHERLGAHGISSWMFAVDDDRYPFAANPGAATRRDKHFAAIIHHVRDPAAAIPSIIVENQYSAASYEFRRKHIRQGLGFDLDTLADPVERAVVAYLSWNRLVDAMKPHLVARIEDGEETVRRFLVERGLVAADFRPGRMPPKDANTRKPYKGQVVAKPVLPPSAWSGLTPETRRELRQFCRTHGYPDPA